MGRTIPSHVPGEDADGDSPAGHEAAHDFLLRERRLGDTHVSQVALSLHVAQLVMQAAPKDQRECEIRK
jgi:hypothetical protein